MALVLCPIAIGIILSAAFPSSPSVATRAVLLAGGEATSFIHTSLAYEQPAANLSEKLLAKHIKGDSVFEAVFVTPPANVNPGLGPHFNNSSCTGCHIGNGRGLPEKGQLLARVSLPQSATSALTSTSPESELANCFLEGSAPNDNAPPVPGLGTQIQDRAVYGQPPEATVEIQWQEQEGQYKDGKAYTLRSPQASITLANGDPLPADVMTSLRVPPPIFGLGLLEALPEETLLALADPNDADGDGISGRPNRVWDVQAGKAVLGRFGWKANQPNLRQQIAAAYINDMGVTNPVFTAADGSQDIDEVILDLNITYAQTLAVPGRSLLDDPQVQRGEELFDGANCGACHVAELRTGSHPIVEVSNQAIHPYTDMLLHDMGAGLADNRPDFAASGTEWRTTPLWGVGLTQAVLPYARYLHDGRANTLSEAILWHGGEAERSKETFRAMSEGDRDALVRFLRTL
jgi:CxxC motif-containing protein (DUF1111 family)